MQGFLSEVKTDSRSNGLLLHVASATEMAEWNKQAKEVPTLYFLTLCSTLYFMAAMNFLWNWDLNHRFGVGFFFYYYLFFFNLAVLREC